jgi:DNA repair protein RecO (recombination protein O)
MALFSDEAIALRTLRLGEADRIVTFVTPEHGKVRAVAKGVRRTKSRIGARVEPLSHVSMLCWRGRELDVINQVEVIDSFRNIRDDLDRMGPALSMLEITDQIALERQAAPAQFALLLGALRSLDDSYSPFLLGAFCFKLLAIEGVGASLASCATCGSPGPLVAFDAGEGGLLCSAHRRGQAVSAEVVAVCQEATSGGLARLLAREDSPLARSFEQLAVTAVEHHLDRRLRSARHLPEVTRRGA